MNQATIAYLVNVIIRDYYEIQGRKIIELLIVHKLRMSYSWSARKNSFSNSVIYISSLCLQTQTISFYLKIWIIFNKDPTMDVNYETVWNIVDVSRILQTLGVQIVSNVRYLKTL